MITAKLTGTGYRDLSGLAGAKAFAVGSYYSKNQREVLFESDDVTEVIAWCKNNKVNK